MARQVQEENDPKRAVPAAELQDSSSDDDGANKALAAMGYAPVSCRRLHDTRPSCSKFTSNGW